jgi:hypothetical protein
MATNFLIALATAFGSATLLLLVLWLVLKVFAPEAFKEMIPISKKEEQTSTARTIQTESQVFNLQISEYEIQKHLQRTEKALFYRLYYAQHGQCVQSQTSEAKAEELAETFGRTTQEKGGASRWIQ